jgi:RHS repeat-associated protein
MAGLQPAAAASGHPGHSGRAVATAATAATAAVEHPAQVDGVAAAGAGMSAKTASAAAALPAAPSVPVGTGPVPNAKFLNFPISDAVSLKVNVGSGNALLTTSDLTLPEMGTSLTLGADYNSLLIGTAATGAELYGWRQRQGVDVRLYVGSDGSITFLGPDGASGKFSAPSSGSTYGSPPVFHATLTSAPSSSCSGWTYQMTWHSTGQVMCFNGDGQLTKQKDRNGNTTTFAYDGNGLETGISYTPLDAPGAAETVTASSSGSTLLGLSENGGSAGTKNVTYTISSQGNLTSVQQPCGVTVYFGYDGSHNLTSVENGDGATTRLTYNSAHQVTAVSQPYGSGSGSATATTRLSYVSSTETQVAAPNTNQSQAVSAVPDTTFTVNAQDLVTKTVDPAGNTSSTAYNSTTNNVTSSVNALGGTTTNTYGSNNSESLTKTVSATGGTTSAVYGNAASGADPTAEYLPSSSKDAQGHQTTYTYFGAGNLSQSSDALPAAAKVTYNNDGSPATSTDPNGGVTSYSYNSEHQLTTVTPPATGSLKPITLTYDGFGRVATVTDGSGNTVTYTYDLADRITKQAYTGGPKTVTVSYGFDNAGNLTSQTSAAATTSWTYDGRNQVLTKSATSGGGTLRYGYDADGNMTSAIDGAGTTSYTYNNLDQLLSMIDPTGVQWEFGYNAAGERTHTYFDSNATGSTYAVKDLLGFDPGGRINLIEQTGNSGASTLNYFTYCYSKYVSGQACPTAPTTSDTSLVQYNTNQKTSVVTPYTYDNGNRLKTATPTSGTAYSYGYDNDGNITTGSQAGSLAYNVANELTTSGWGFDHDGNLTADPSNGVQAYSDASQLSTVSAAGGGGGGSAAETFTYAGANQDEPLSDGSATGITYGLADQYGQPWVDSYTTGGGTSYVIRDQQGDPLGMVRGGQSYIYLTNDQGSVISVAGTCGCVDAAYAYTPYGALAAKSAGDGGSLVTQNLIGYTGALTDTFTKGSTGYVHDGARWYNPQTGEFAGQDAGSYLASPANGNRFSYAGDDPVNHIDPTGNSCGSAGLVSGAAAEIGGDAEAGIALTEASLSEEAVAAIGLTTLSVVSGFIGLGVVGVVITAFALSC